MSDSVEITSVLKEGRVFQPPADFGQRSGGAHVASMEDYRARHKRSLEDPEGFWGEIASQLDWFEPWTQVCEWKLPDAKWFVGGKTNICHNCVDRQVDQGHGDQLAILWEAEPTNTEGEPEVRRLTYSDLKRETAKLANVLEGLGVRKGDVVTIYMGMVPELAIAILACARIGAVHSVIFGGFSSQAIADRVEDASSSIILTCDGSWRRGSIFPLKANVDAACELTDTIKSVLVLARCHNTIQWKAGRDHWWGPWTAKTCSSCSTPRARPVSRRGSCTRPAATWSTPT